MSDNFFWSFYLMSIIVVVICFLPFHIKTAISEFNAKQKNVKNKKNFDIIEYYLCTYNETKNSYPFVHVDDFDSFLNDGIVFYLKKVHGLGILDEDKTAEILNSGDIEVMLGLGNAVQIWQYIPKNGKFIIPKIGIFDICLDVLVNAWGTAMIASLVLLPITAIIYQIVKIFI